MHNEFGICPMNVISFYYGNPLIWGLLYYISIQVYINCIGKGKRTGPIWGKYVQSLLESTHSNLPGDAKIITFPMRHKGIIYFLKYQSHF